MVQYIINIYYISQTKDKINLTRKNRKILNIEISK